MSGPRENVKTLPLPAEIIIFPLLDIGEYSVSVEMSGFKTSNRTNLLLQINEKLRVDFALEVGQVSERVEVTGEAATLKTDEASIGDVIEQKRIVELPINGRNVGNVAVLQAGVMFGARGGLDGQSGSGGGIPIPGQNIALVANGQREVSQHATLDGVVATEARVNTVPFSPSPEAIEEVKVFTGTYSAEYGFNSGAQLIMVMRSGTNQLHGTAFEFLRNDKLDAESYFQNYFNTSATRLPKQGIRQNQFGGMASGPVFIPKVYNGKDKTFWMFNYEGRRRSLPGAAESALVPSDRMRNGDFGELLTRSNASGSLAPFLFTIRSPARQLLPLLPTTSFLRTELPPAPRISLAFGSGRKLSYRILFPASTTPDAVDRRSTTINITSRSTITSRSGTRSWAAMRRTSRVGTKFLVLPRNLRTWFLVGTTMLLVNGFTFLHRRSSWSRGMATRNPTTTALTPARTQIST
jgi:hypothetical protein